MSQPPAELAELAARLERALTEELGRTPALPNPEGWQITEVAPRFFQIWRVLVSLRAADRTIGFLLSPTDPNERAYRRTPRFDFVYFSEDVPDHEQDRIYRRDRATIDRFAAWLDDWDRRTRGA
ncbi:MAG TPA: hypothetical protein VIL20_12900 [Sandaracinaceae bacterium]